MQDNFSRPPAATREQLRKRAWTEEGVVGEGFVRLEVEDRRKLEDPSRALRKWEKLYRRM